MLSSQVQNFAYDALGRLRESTAGVTAGDQSYTLDANGNMIRQGSAIQVYEYDPFNRLSSVTTSTGGKTTYVINALGQRVYKTQGSPNAAFYVYGPDAQLAVERSGFSGSTCGRTTCGYPTASRRDGPEWPTALHPH
ncbi:hypothetical protein [Luteimonas sp. R10]|uniref:hypothetical protein n=1 Tax=Luteimonas sp. R10 TaxID=3108176 RepID=UPI003086E949|nr:hypothetical protein U3649_01245 [Luteimonas sp. R10]